MTKEKTRKCPVCKEEGIESQMISYPKRYKTRLLHQECRDLIQEKDKKEEKERSDREHFWKKFTEFLDIETKDIPRGAYEYAMNLRQGNNTVGATSVSRKRMREGFEWKIIEKSMIESQDAMRYALQTKNFKSVNSLFRYLFAIISDKIVLIDKREKELLKRDKRDMSGLNMDIMEAMNKQSKRKSVNANDISAFLEDGA